MDVAAEIEPGPNACHVLLACGLPSAFFRAPENLGRRYERFCGELGLPSRLRRSGGEANNQST